MTTETKETTKKKGSRPTHEIFPVSAEGKPEYKARAGAWAHSKGGGYNFSIGGKRYVMFPVKAQLAGPSRTRTPPASRSRSLSRISARAVFLGTEERRSSGPFHLPF